MNTAEQLSQVYLDANATTPVLPEAAAAAMAAMQHQFGNPSSSHITGIEAKDLMEQARRRGQRIIGGDNGQLIFTSGATEGIQTAILSALLAAKATMLPGKPYCVLYGATEHKAVPESLKHWLNVLAIDAELKAIPVDKYGLLEQHYIREHASNALMICTMAVNNETGAVQDLAGLEQTIRQANPSLFWMVDCVQALGKIDLNLVDISIDYAPFSGHKLYATKGIGFVYVRNSAPLTPFVAGGGQEKGLRSGTENLPGMAALNVIFKMLLQPEGSVFVDSSTLVEYRDQLADTLTRCFPSVVFNNSFNHSVPTTINFAVPGFTSKEIMDLFDAANIRVSSGSACSSKVTRSFVLDAMGLPAWQSEAAIRLSYGPAMTKAEIDIACKRIELAAQALSLSCLAEDQTQVDSDNPPFDGLMQMRSGANCTWLYVDGDSKQALVIDPLPELTQRIDTLVQCQQLELVAVLDTHGHADHESGRKYLANRYLPKQQTDPLGWPTRSLQSYAGFAAITIGQRQLVKVATPGHTADSISLLLCNLQSDQGSLSYRVDYAFCGDTILMGSLGRTDFDCSSSAAMYRSLKLLNECLEPKSLICASHDYNNEFTTTLAAEANRNPLLNGVLNLGLNEATFINQKALLDANLNDEVGTDIMCGALVSDCESHAITEFDGTSFAAAKAEHDDIEVLDIREPHEHAFSKGGTTCRNVPLNRLVQFIQENQHNKLRRWVLVCRSGSRSLVAAQAMHRLGFKNVAHVKGGYALNRLDN